MIQSVPYRIGFSGYLEAIMTLVQKFFMTVLPKRWAESMRRQSMAWKMQCRTCGNTQSIWDAGGVRWLASSTTKRTLGRCSHCGTSRHAVIKKETGTTLLVR